MVSPMVLFSTLALLPLSSSFLIWPWTSVKAERTVELTAPPITSPSDSLLLAMLYPLCVGLNP
ncbi:hypothetical protein D3C77_543430 [compost metagenome]